MSAQSPWRTGQFPETAGYRPLADLMAAYPNLAIFRRFQNLGTLDLLYRQAEIQGLLYKWHDVVVADRDSNDIKRNRFDIDYKRLLDSFHVEGATGVQRRQWHELSAQLDQYYDRLLKFQKIRALPPVDKTYLGQLNDHLIHADKGAGFLMDIEEEIYAELNEADLTSIIAQPDPDLFTLFARGTMIDWFHKLVYGKDSLHTIKVPKTAEKAEYDFWFKEYSPESSLLLSRFLVSVLTALIITVAIISLNLFQQANSRIVLIFFHNLIFSMSMAVLARARAAEVFAISAAYAAVLVAYASGSSSLFGKPGS